MRRRDLIDAAASFVHVDIDMSQAQLVWEEGEKRLWIRGHEGINDHMVTVVLKGLSMDALLEKIAQA